MPRSLKRWTKIQLIMRLCTGNGEFQRFRHIGFKLKNDVLIIDGMRPYF